MVDLGPFVLRCKDGYGPVLPSRSAGGSAVAVLVALRAEVLSGSTRLCERQLNRCFRPYISRVAV